MEECNKMKFSVLISVYERDNPEHFKEAIESIVHQTVKPDEIVLVIDGPIGNHLRKMVNRLKEAYKIIKVIPLSKNLGLGNALRIGLEQCTHDIVARMDSDDIAVENRFQKQINFLKENEDISVVGGVIDEFVIDPSMPNSIRKVPVTCEEINKGIKNRCPFNHMTVMYRKRDVLEAGSYMELHFCEDYYLWVRMYLKGYTFFNIDEVLVHARVDEELFVRRGGKKYFESHKRLQKFMLDSKVIGYMGYIKNLGIRWLVQVVMPNKLRKNFYKKLLRS